ncbi:MAG: SLC13/DASS family transporter [Cyclobacteriaceae bacterium]|nr:SLC13/DASS family transporter [Cyclobacteriaceae bacterium]
MNTTSKKTDRIKLSIAIITPVIILLIPKTWFPIQNLTVIEHRVIALFVFAAIFWILEPVPIYATSILIIVLELVFLSDSSLYPARGEGENFGVVMSHKEIMSTLASPVILLFLGGFFLAMAATKYRLDQNIARVLLHRFGENPKWVLLGLMIITSFFSMFMSNTATTAMMLSILIPVLKIFPAGDKAKTAFILSIPIAANIGGIGTPIGTPPNAIALKYITGATMTFGKWMSFGVPFVIVMLILSWVLLLIFFPAKTKTIRLSITGTFLTTPKAILVYITFIVTIFLWLFDFIHGMNAYVVAMIPVGVFLSLGIINKEDLKNISWDVLWLVSGGIALGLALEKTGLAQHVIESIPFESFSPYVVILAAASIGLVMANFMSNTATANLILPLLASLGTTVAGLENVGGSQLIVLGTTIAISLGMSLPISTPPNALAHATGEIYTNDMSKIGVMIGLIGLIFVIILMIILQYINFLT